MAALRVYVSAFAGELKSARDRVAAKLETLGCEAVWVDYTAGDDWQLHADEVRRQMTGCRGLLLVLGDQYGSDADPALTGKEGRCSWNQWEYLEAQQRRMNTWVIAAGPGVTRERSERADQDNGACGEHAELVQAFTERPEIKYCPLARDDAHLLDLVPDPRQASAAPVAARAAARPSGGRTFRQVIRIALALASAITVFVQWQNGGLKKYFGRKDGDEDEIRSKTQFVDPVDVSKALEKGFTAAYHAELAAARSAAGEEVQKRQANLVQARWEYRTTRLGMIMERFLDEGRRGRDFSVNVDLAASVVDGGAAGGLRYIGNVRKRLLAAAKKDEVTAARRARLMPLLWAVDLHLLIGDIGAARTAGEEMAGVDADWVELKEAVAFVEYAASCEALAQGDPSAAITFVDRAAALAGPVPPSDTEYETIRQVQRLIRLQSADARLALNALPESEKALTELNQLLPGEVDRAQRPPRDPAMMRAAARLCAKTGDLRHQLKKDGARAAWAQGFVLLESMALAEQLTKDDIALWQRLADQLGPAEKALLQRKGF